MLLLLLIGKAFCALLLVSLLLLRWRRIISRRKSERSKRETIVGFFHPYCNAGGGGERVLWAAIKALQNSYPQVHIVVYTGDLDAHPDQIIDKVAKDFNIRLVRNVEFIYLHRRKWLEAKTYPYFTLIGQSLGSIWLAAEALNTLPPDVYIDTTGCAFTYPLLKYIGGCRVGTYTHFPTISTDMLRHVYRRVASHNNSRAIARNPFLSAGKIVYYKVFAMLYGWTGRAAEVILVNSSWTEEHINAIWKCPLRTHRVYPPCEVQHLTSLPLLNNAAKGIRIVSVGQFRPEKNHPLMLRSMFELRSLLDEETWNQVKLVLIGSCRNQEDETRVKDMQDLAKHLALDENVEFKLNIPYVELTSELQFGTIGLHCMWNEHFGISVVESMAAGLIMVAHASGGPKADIIETQESCRNGFLAEDAEEYAEVISQIIKMSPEERNRIRNAARSSVNRFSGEQFEVEFLRSVEPFFRRKQD